MKCKKAAAVIAGLILLTNAVAPIVSCEKAEAAVFEEDVYVFRDVYLSMCESL